jgi:hypothetical protein
MCTFEGHAREIDAIALNLDGRYGRVAALTEQYNPGKVAFYRHRRSYQFLSKSLYLQSNRLSRRM